MSDLLSSKVSVVEEEPRIRAVQPVPTGTLGILGIAERGPHERTLVTSYEQFVAQFGGFNANGDLALAVRGFFENGGSAVWVKRVVHYSDPGNAASKTSAKASLTVKTANTASSKGSVTGSETGPFELADGDTVVASVDGGADETATFNATAAERTSGNTETFALSDGEVLDVAIDGGDAQSIAFSASEFDNIGAATAAEVAAVLNAKLVGAAASVDAGAVRIASDTKGTDSGVDVQGGTANAALGFTTGNQAGTGNVGDVSAVTAAEAASVIDAALAGATATEVSGKVKIESDTSGAGSSIQVKASSTADDELGLDNAVHTGDDGTPQDAVKIDGKTDGAYANALKVQVTEATSGKSDEFNLRVLRDGVILEAFPNLSVDPDADNYLERVVNDADAGSALIAVEDLEPSNSDPRPARTTHGPLTGGDDGIVGIDDNDFIGAAGGQTGLRGFDDVDIQILACPDRATAAVHNAMLDYAQDTRGMSVFAVLDPPEGEDTAGINEYVTQTASLLNASELGAIYWPRVKIINPSREVFGDAKQIVVPPSGHIAGTYVRVDSSQPGGVYRAPAGVERGRLRGVVGLETEAPNREADRDLVYPNRVNPIRTGRGIPIIIDGVRTLKGNGNFPTVPERRGAIFIEQTIKNGIEVFRFAPNTEATRGRASRTVTAFLTQEMNVGAFATRDPATAFFVDFGEGLNPPSVIFSGKMVGRIGLATAKPAEFIVLRFSQDTRALEEELAQ